MKLEIKQSCYFANNINKILVSFQNDMSLKVKQSGLTLKDLITQQCVDNVT